MILSVQRCASAFAAAGHCHAAHAQRRWYGPSSFDLGPRKLPDGLSDVDVANHLRWTLGKVSRPRKNSRQAEQLSRALLADMKMLKEKGYQVGSMAHTQAVNLLARWGREWDARDLLDEMKRKKLVETSEPYENLIKAYALLGDMATVQSVIKEMQQMQLPVTRQAYNYVLLGFARRGERQHALQLLQAMEQQQLQPDRQSYIFAIGSCQKYSDAREIFDKMSEKGIQYSDRCFDALMKVCDRAGDAESAMVVLNDSSEYGMQPSAEIYNKVMQLHLRPLNFTAVAGLYRSMREQHVTPDFITYCVFLRACKLSCVGDAAADARPVAIAEAALQQARVDGVDHREVYRELLSLYNKVGNSGKAEEITAVMLNTPPADQASVDVYS